MAFIHWLALNWLIVLPWVLYGLSDLMPYLPGKAQNVIGLILNIGKAVLAGKGKPPELPAAK